MRKRLDNIVALVVLLPCNMKKIPFKDKQRVSVFLTAEEELKLRKKALEAGVSLSEYVSRAGTISSVEEIKNYTEPEVESKVNIVG